MLRVMHLSGREPDFQTSRSMDLLRREIGPGFAVDARRIGRGGDWRNMAFAVAGLRRGGQWAVGSGQGQGTEARRHEGTKAIAFNPQSEIRNPQSPDDPPSAIGAPCLIHAFDGRALAAAVLGSRAPVLYTPAAFPSVSHVRWLRAMMAYRRDLHVTCPTATMRRFCVERGVPLERCHLIRPGVEFARVRGRRDRALRASLGIADSDYVMLACGESTAAAGHELAVWATSMLHILDPHYRLLIWGRGSRAHAVARFAAGFPGGRERKRNGEWMNGEWGMRGASSRAASAIPHSSIPHSPLPAAPASPFLRIAEPRLGRPVAFEELLPAADLVLVTQQDAAPTLPVATCMAAGLPIVSTVTYTVAELLEDRHTAAMVAEPRARLIAKRVLEVRADSQLQWSMADMARTEAYEFFAATRFLEQHREAYRQLAAGRPVDIPEPQPGAGQRFFGRAGVAG